MNKLKLSTALDGFFVFSVSFFIYYAFIKTKILSVLTATGVTVLLSSLTTFLFMIMLFYFDENKLKKQKDASYISDFFNYLYFLREKDILNLFQKFLEKENKNFEIKSGALFFKGSNSYLFYSFKPEPLTQTDVLNFYKKATKNSNVYVIACTYKQGTKEFFLQCENVKLFTADILFNSLKNAEMLPEIKTKTKEKIKLKQLFFSIYRRENVKKFFFWGVLLCLFSTITYYKIFYATVGSLFLLSSLYLKFFTKEKTLN